MTRRREAGFRGFIGIVVPSFLAFSVAFTAALAGIAAGPRQASGEPPDSEEARIVAVLDFEARNVSPEAARRLCDSLSSCLRHTGQFIVPDRQEAERAVSEVTGTDGAGWVCRTSDCAARIGRKVRAGSVVIGSVSELGRLWSVSATVVDAYSGEVIDDLTAESLTGEAGMPEVLRQLAEQIERMRDRLPTVAAGPYPDERLLARRARSERYTSSLGVGIGLGLSGYDAEGGVCRSTGCTYASATLQWLIEMSMASRVTESGLSVGLRGGVLYVQSRVRGGESGGGLKFHLYPQVGYLLYESDDYRLMPFVGGGYRDFSEASGVDRSFLCGGVALRVFRLRADAIYWRGLKGESLLKNMVTLSVGTGIGY